MIRAEFPEDFAFRLRVLELFEKFADTDAGKRAVTESY